MVFCTADKDRNWGMTLGLRLCYQPYLMAKIFKPLSMQKELLYQSLCESYEQSMSPGKRSSKATILQGASAQGNELMVPLIA